MKDLDLSPLAKKSAYENNYNPNVLFPIKREIKRKEIGIGEIVPFYGVDIWNHYEISWLNIKGKPEVALGQISYSCSSPSIIESKSMKLYFNSFNHTKFNSWDEIEKIVITDLSNAVESVVDFKLIPVNTLVKSSLNTLDGVSLDALDVECTTYHPCPSYLVLDGTSVVEEVLYSDLLKSNCLVTNQPDWGSIFIHYKGNQINHEGLLKYIVSLRDHNEFHEQCVERVFVEILNWCSPLELTVYARYTRRGGLDINPYRSTKQEIPEQLNNRLVRQ